MFHVPEKYRLTKAKDPLLGTDKSHGNNGVFIIPHPKIVGYTFCCIVSDCSIGNWKEQWEHVSIHVASDYRDIDRCPTWGEMCMVKDIFWDKTDCVVQYHPAESEYVNCHPTTLHLWRPVGFVFPIPPKEFV